MIIQILTLNKNNITDFARERNVLLKKAKADWVLFLDTDEIISPAFRQEINQLASNSVKLINGYYVKRKNYFLGQFIGTDKILRLGRKDSGKWVRRVHEVWKIGKVHTGGVLDNYITHSTAENLAGYINKVNYYSDLHALANKEEGKKSNLFKIIFFPIGKFAVTLFKSRNIVFGIMQAFHSFLSWSKLYFSHS